MGYRVLLILMAVMVSMCAGVSMSRLEREAAFAEYSSRIKNRLVSLSYNWADGWQEFLVPGPKPEEKAVVDQVHFLLWTRSNPNLEFVLEAFNADSFAASNFDASKDTYIEFHGFTADGKTQWILDSKDALLDRVDVNVISVDWGELAAGPDYITAVAGVYDTSELTANLLDWMVDNVGLSFSMTNLAGHSLGAQCAGMTGNYVVTGKLNRVTGLDPAAPLFDETEESQRINPSSANFVDIIHSNAGPLTDGCLGMIDQVGQVDFYPNGGSHQPGCPLVNSSDIIDLATSCSHGRAPEYWIESIIAQEPAANTFWAKPCSDWSSYEAGLCTDCGNGCLQMGFPDDISGVNIGLDIEYYLRTNPDEPFAQGLN